MAYKDKIININGSTINSNNRVYVIAEIGMNHNGSFNRAIKLVDKAIDAGADCVKFQLRDLKELYSKDALDITSSDLATQYTVRLLEKFALTKMEYKKIYNYCNDKKINFMCTPWDKSSLVFLENIGVTAYKIASADLTNVDLINAVIKTKKTLILSTGMSTENEINTTVKLLKKSKAKFALLHTNSTYPTPDKDLNLRYIQKLSDRYAVPVGYSGHERGIDMTLAAVALGASIIERHITLDKNLEGPDHTASLLPTEFKSLINSIRRLEKSLGFMNKRIITQGELINRENLGKSIYTKKKISKGTEIKKSMLEVKSPGQGLSPQYLDSIIGKKTLATIEKGKPLFESHYKRSIKAKKEYKFTLDWGIPTRFHDVEKLSKITSPKIYEFHLSYDDLNEDIDHFLDMDYESNFIVHAPELFKNDHLLDLCTSNKKYRQQSIKNMREVIDLSIKLQEKYPLTKNVYIITNTGGFSKNDFLNKSKRNNLYNNLLESLRILKTSSATIIPQNMAPFPWHFGGQRYQTLFMQVDEIIKFCKKSRTGICHDISHSYMACNHFGWDHVKYTKDLSKYAYHYHIADAVGVDGEGLQIGNGEVSFYRILPIIKKYSKNASFIPEIWQGHKNDGEGFWKALKMLENLL